jgi:hypothetical protein
MTLNLTVISKNINYPTTQVDISELEVRLDSELEEARGWGFNPVLKDAVVTEEKVKVRLRNSSAVDSAVVNALLLFLKGSLNKILGNLLLGLNQNLSEMSSQAVQV